MHGFGHMLKDYLDYYKISQTEFADRLNITQKHMNEIINGKTSLSLDLILAISLLTDIDADLIFQIERKKKINQYLNTKYKTEKELRDFLNSYSIKEMDKRRWLRLHDVTSNVQNYIDLIDYLNIKDLDTFDKVLEKRYLFKKKDDADKRKIYLWIRHCDIETKEIRLTKTYNSNNFNSLLDELQKESTKPFNQDNIIKILGKYGIILYIEDPLKGSKVRGCITVKIDTPYIYMTKYYKEKSSFYFSLYHELMHLKHDYNRLKSKVFIEHDESEENEIDKKALDIMIKPDVYKKIRDNLDKKDIIAKENNIPLCFLYTRLAKEGIISYKSKEYLNNIEKI